MPKPKELGIFLAIVILIVYLIPVLSNTLKDFFDFIIFFGIVALIGSVIWHLVKKWF